MKDRRGGKRKAGKQPMYKMILPHSKNQFVGVKEAGHEYDRLKLEIAVGTAKFWKARGLSDPGRLLWRMA